MATTEEKLENLRQILVECKNAVVAFSGGVDSSFLAAAAYRALGSRAVAVTAYSATLGEREEQACVDLARHIGIEHHFVDADELQSADFSANSGDRCYFCKQVRFAVLMAWAKQHGFSWVVEGANADDLHDYRPGMKALAGFATVKSPLLMAELTKEEIRAVSREWGLPTWDKPSAACLSSRIAYGLTITAERLHQVERAEAFIQKLGIRQVRVRHHDTLARIEVPSADIPRLAEPKIAAGIAAALKEIGFLYATLDLTGYRTGSMNEALPAAVKASNPS